MEFILIILSSLLFTLPHYFPALFFLSYFAFVPLIYLIKDYDYSHSFIIALLVGFLNSVFSLYWLHQPLSSALKMPFSFNIFILFLYFLISALILAVWAILNKFLQPKYSYSPFIAALSWTVLEYLRFEFFNFNPFNYFAYTQSSFSLISRYADYGGIFLVSFIAVLIASYPVKVYLESSWKKAVPLLLILIILITIPLFNQSTAEEEIEYKKVDLAVVETGEKSSMFKKIEGEIEALSNLVKNTESKYIFTPIETLSFDLIRNNYYRNQLNSQLEQSLQSSYLQLGSRAAESDSYDAEIFNSLFLLTEDLELENRSNKKRNTLSGLNLPYLKEISSYISGYLNFDQELISSSELNETIKIEDLNYLNLFSDEIFLPLVSRDSNYPDELNLIVNSAAEEKIDSKVYSNLALAAAVYRAAETNTPVIRAVSGGYSAYINADGKILMKKRLDNNKKTINLALQKNESYYRRHPNRIINIIITVFLSITLIKIIILVKNKWSSRN
ncbi:MAG: copper homeostasis protein CutE [bacterium]